MSNWQNFLAQQGAQWENEHLIGFTSSSDQHPTKLTSLEDYGLLIISGPEAEKFLQGQCTCDIRRLANHDVLLGAHCNHKGRMISSFYAFLIAPNTVGLRMHKSILEIALNALKKYSVFSKVELRLGTEYRLIGLWGDDAECALDPAFPMPETNHSGVNCDTGSIIRHDINLLEIWLKSEAAEQQWQILATHSSLASPSEWNATCIKAGIGEVRIETTETFIPQMLNFQEIDGISFNKGCYTGQEVVARMHYRGKLKKHMYRATIGIKHSVPKPGASLYAMTDTGSKNIGTVVIAAAGAKAIEILAVVPSEVFEKTSVFLNENSQMKLSWASLPYAIT